MRSGERVAGQHDACHSRKSLISNERLQETLPGL